MRRETESALRAVALSFEATRADLERIAATFDEPPTPLLRDFTPIAMALLTGRTRETYGRHIDHLTTALGHRRLDEITLLDLERVATEVQLEARARPSSRHGYGAQESFVNAARFVFAAAVKGGHLRESPASELGRPRRRRSARRALSGDELAAIFDAVLLTSRDVELDLLLLATARETACRREGLLNLRREDLSPAPSVMLYEKYEERREIPISASLSAALLRPAIDRSPEGEFVFHYRDGQHLTNRRFDTLFRRVGARLPWVSSLGVTLHWIRYTTLTDVRLVAGERVATAYAGHRDGAGGVTALYTRATFAELQRAHRLIFGGSTPRP